MGSETLGQGACRVLQRMVSRVVLKKVKKRKPDGLMGKGHGILFNMIILGIIAGGVTRLSEGLARGRPCKPGGPDKIFKAPDGTTVLSLGLSPGGDLLVGGTEAGALLVFSVEKSRPPVSLDLGGSVRTVRILSKNTNMKPRGHLIAAGGDFGLVIVQYENNKKYKVLKVLKKKGGIMALAHNARGGELASAGRDRKITIWDMESWKKKRVIKGHTSWVSTLVFSLDGQKIFSGGWDNTVRAFRVSDGESLWTNYEHQFALNRLMALRDRKTLVSLSDDGRLRLIRVSDGRRFQLSRVGPGVGAVVMGKKEVVVMSSWRGRIMILSYPELRPIGSFSAQLSPVNSMAGLASGLVAVAGGQGRINLWVLPVSCIH